MSRSDRALIFAMLAIILTRVTTGALSWIWWAVSAMWCVIATAALIDERIARTKGRR